MEAEGSSAFSSNNILSLPFDEIARRSNIIGSQRELLAHFTKHDASQQFIPKDSLPKNVAERLPIGFFWDLESCKVPNGYSPLNIVGTIRALFLADKREEDFVIVCNVHNHPPAVIKQFCDAQVNIYHVSNLNNNCINTKLQHLMVKFAKINPAPAIIGILTGDPQIVEAIHHLQSVYDMKIALINAPPKMLENQHKRTTYTPQQREHPQNISASVQDKRYDTVVWNLPTFISPGRIMMRLEQLADNCGGKVIQLSLPTATMRFPSETHAMRSILRMTHEDVFGHKIIVSSSAVGILPPISPQPAEEDCMNDQMPPIPPQPAQEDWMNDQMPPIPPQPAQEDWMNDEMPPIPLRPDQEEWLKNEIPLPPDQEDWMNHQFHPYRNLTF